MSIAVITFLLLSFVVPYKFKFDQSLNKEKYSLEKLKVSFFIDPRVLSGDTQEVIIMPKDTCCISRILETLAKFDVIFFKKLKILYVKGDPRQIIFYLMKFSNDIIGVYPNIRYHTLDFKITENLETKSKESIEMINVSPLWSDGYFGLGVKVAVIDTGIDPMHPELESKVIRAKSFVLRKYGYEEDEEFVEDVIGHGTMVASVIGAKGLNPEYIGVAPNVTFINARVFPASGEGATFAGIIAAIEWSVDAGANIINLSLGGVPLQNDPFIEVIRRVTELGVVVVVAAGNSGYYRSNRMSIASPGISKDCITAGAIGKDYNVTFYSSFGPAPGLYVKPDVVAPGDVYAAVPGGGYKFVRGTSFAAPHVSGVAALLLEVLKDRFGDIPRRYIPAIIKAAIVKGATRSGSELVYGAGILNAGRSYDILLKAPVYDNIPAIIDILPHSIPQWPSFPWNRSLFLGQHVEFNITLISSIEREISIRVSGNISDGIDFVFSNIMLIYPGTTLISVRINVNADATIGYREGFIEINASGELLKIAVSFYVKKPILRVLLDLSHTAWLNDYKYGFFGTMCEILEELGISIEHNYWGQRIDSHLLEKYDVLMIPDAASYRAIFNASGFIIETEAYTFSSEEINAIVNFVESGKMLILNAMVPADNVILANDWDELSELTTEFGVVYSRNIIYSDRIEYAKRRFINELSIYLKKVPHYGGLVGTYTGYWQNEYVWTLPFMYGYVGVAMVHRVYNTLGMALFLTSRLPISNFALSGLLDSEEFTSKNVKEMIISLFVSRAIIKNISISIDGELKVDQIVKINVTFSQNSQISVNKILLSDYLGITQVAFSVEENLVAFSIKPRVARHNLLLMMLNYSNYNVTVGIPLNITPSEFEKPQIRKITVENNTVFEYAKSAEITDVEFEIIIADNYRISSNLVHISAYYRHYKVLQINITKIVINETVIKIRIRIPAQAIRDLLFFRSEQQIIFLIFFSDVNLNGNHTCIVLNFRRTYWTWEWLALLLFIAIIVIFMILTITKR